MPDTQYFYADGSQQRGPHGAAEIVAMRLAPATLVWCEGMPNWQRLDSVAELNPPPEAPPSDASPGAPPPDASPTDAPPPGTVPPNVPPPFTHPHAQPMGYGVAPARDDSKKILAGILGILFGGLGVHKFVLGYNQAGIIMLSVSLGCTFFGCCVGPLLLVPFAMSIIGLVEGIMYLCKSDDEFYHTYVLNRREWF